MLSNLGYEDLQQFMHMQFEWMTVNAQKILCWNHEAMHSQEIAIQKIYLMHFVQFAMSIVRIGMTGIQINKNTQSEKNCDHFD